MNKYGYFKDIFAAVDNVIKSCSGGDARRAREALKEVLKEKGVPEEERDLVIRSVRHLLRVYSDFGGGR